MKQVSKFNHGMSKLFIQHHCGGDGKQTDRKTFFYVRSFCTSAFESQCFVSVALFHVIFSTFSEIVFVLYFSFRLT